MEGFVQKVSAPRGKRRNKPPVCGGRTAPPKEGKDNPPLREKLKRQREKPNKICKTVAVPLPRKTTLSKLETLNSAIPWLQTHRLPGMSAAPRFGTNTINTLFGKPDFRRRRRFATSPNISIAHVKKTGDPQKKENPFQSRNQALKTPQTSKSSSNPPPRPQKKRRVLSAFLRFFNRNRSREYFATPAYRGNCHKFPHPTTTHTRARRKCNFVPRRKLRHSFAAVYVFLEERVF